MFANDTIKRLFVVAMGVRCGWGGAEEEEV